MPPPSPDPALPAGGSIPRRRLPRLWRRRSLWWPTATGWVLLLLAAGSAGAVWWFHGEDFLAVTDRPGQDVLVVEGWIGNSGIRAAAAEFLAGHYHYVIATGGLTSERWDREQWSYAEMAERDLLAAGVPASAILVAKPRPTPDQRTFETAVATRAVLERRAIAVHSLTIFTLGAHARRSRLIFRRVFPSGLPLGAIAWQPAADRDLPWWRSSERAEDFLKETAGLAYEFLLHSGRSFGRD